MSTRPTICGKYVGMYGEKLVCAVKVVDIQADGTIVVEYVGGPYDGDRATMNADEDCTFHETFEQAIQAAKERKSGL